VVEWSEKNEGAADEAAPFVFASGKGMKEVPTVKVKRAEIKKRTIRF
jgi:hypothetical protein